MKKKGILIRSFKAQMFFAIIGLLPILVLSASYILYTTIRLQDSMNKGLSRQLEIRAIQGALTEFQAPLLEYLSTRSSNALSDLLARGQNLKSSIKPSHTIPVNQILLQEREVYALVLGYLDIADRVIDDKRGLDVTGYTALYERSTEVLNYIHIRIEAISSARLTEQQRQYSAFISKNRAIQSWNLVFILCVSLFTALLLISTIEKLARPMSLLSENAGRIAAGEFEGEDIPLSLIGEMDDVIGAFNRMKKDIHTYIQEIKWQRSVEQEYIREKIRSMKLESTLRRMELYTMQAQMNPHFLFNALNTGIQLAIIEGADRTSDYMDKLSLLLRHNIREKNAIVPLRNEIEGLESYLYLLRIRFPKNLTIVLDCPDELLDQFDVPVTIMQPLVENCIVHAFKNVERKNDEKNSITVVVQLHENILDISVSDNGCGFTEEAANAVLKHSAPHADYDSANEENTKLMSMKVMGLENVVQRLRFFYPHDERVISIESQQGQSTTIRIQIDTEKQPCIL